MLNYFSKVYHIGEIIKGVKDKRLKPQIKITVISFTVLIGFMLQIPSFNRLEYWIKKGKFKKLLPRKTKMPSIDAVRYCLDRIEIDSLNNMHRSIIKTAVENKVFRNGTIDGYKVAAIDGVELFESTKKCCEECLTRVVSGVTHYFHRSVVCMTVGSDPHIILGEEMLKPKKDGSNKDEGELTGGKRLIRRLHEEFNHFADIVVADALYMKAPWIRELLDLGIDAVIRVKDERLGIVKEATALYKCLKADREWIVSPKGRKKIKVTAWDKSDFEMTGLEDTVRFVKFVEEIHHGNKFEEKEVWIVTTNKSIAVETLWKIIHRRWDIENNGFHQLKGEWNLDHCFLHSSSGVEAVLTFMMMAFNLMQLFFFRCIRNFRERKLLQVNIIEDLRDELILYCNINPIMMNTS